MWIKINFAGFMMNAWQCPDPDLYGFINAPSGFTWAQIDADAPYRLFKIA